MVEHVYHRVGAHYVVVQLRVPRLLWDRWEFRHRHFGKALHALRETCIEVMAAGPVRDSYIDAPDPFHRG
jgi:hypothetical protein